MSGQRGLDARCHLAETRTHWSFLASDHVGNVAACPYDAYQGIVVAEGAIAASGAVATASAAATAGAITVGVLATAFWLYKFIECKRAMIYHVAHMR
jgi:hypothetical protein